MHLGDGTWQIRHPLPGLRVPPRARRRQDHARAGVGVRRELARRARPRAAELAAAGAGAGRYAARHSAHRSRASGLVPERLERGHEDDQRRAPASRRARRAPFARSSIRCSGRLIRSRARRRRSDLSSIESRAHSFEDDLKALREKPDLSGNDFLPLVIKLDDLLTHLQSVSELVSRLSKFQMIRTEAPAPASRRRRPIDESAQATRAARDRLRTGRDPAAARRPGRRGERQASAGPMQRTRPRARGVPPHRQGHRHPGRAQCRRARHRAGRDARRRGQIAAGHGAPRFQESSATASSSASRTTGRALRPIGSRRWRCRRASSRPIRRRTSTPRKCCRCCFSRDSPRWRRATKDAGRGVGMNLMADLMRQIGGRVGVATAPGKYTRVTVTLPAPPRPIDDTVAA